MNSKSGESNREWGKQAEKIACDYLITHGYTVRETNWRVGNTIEIDIIAEKGNIIIFVEVKARKGDYMLPTEAIDEKKMRKIVKGGDIYLRGLKHPYEYRLDIITITGTPEHYEIRHIPDAFLPPLS